MRDSPGVLPTPQLGLQDRAHGARRYVEGEVVWKLGGRASDFTFVDTEEDPDRWALAQHTATELPNGDIMVFDNGAWAHQPVVREPCGPGGSPGGATG